jgi:mannosyltransferase OCH1-like enzyme
MIPPLPSVPRLIFLTWKTRRIPESVRACVESFYRRNPSWVVVVMSDEDCLTWLRARRPADVGWYEALPKGILRADAIRLLWLHAMGGIYADIDVECLRPLDELIALLPAHKNIGITRDHPFHERDHYGNIEMWMNDFMVARPGAALIGEALRQLRAAVESGREFDPRNAVMDTGPALLNRALRVLGGLESAGVEYLPWERVHPLPDMTNAFPEKEAAAKAIRARAWRGDAPWVAHYWYHTWCSTRNMVLEFNDCLFAPAEEAAMERLARYDGYLGKRAHTTKEAIQRLAGTAGPVTVVELGVTRSFVSEPPRDVVMTDRAHWRPDDAAAWDWGAGCFTRVVVETLAGYDCIYHGVDPSAESLAVAKITLEPIFAETAEEATAQSLATELDAGVLAWAGPAELRRRIHFHQKTAAAFLETWGGQADLIYMDHGECSEETAAIHAMDARTILERDLVKPGGLVLIDDHAPQGEGDKAIPKSQTARAVFEEAGWAMMAEGYQLLLQRPYEVPDYIPRTVHVFGDARRRSAYDPGIAAAWAALHPDWEIQSWDDEALRDFVTAECPTFLDTWVDYRSEKARRAAGKILVLKHYGGVAVDPDIYPLQGLDDLFSGRHMIAIRNCAVDAPEGEQTEAVRADFLACSAEHPFWNGVEYELKTHRWDEPSSASGSHFLTRRLRDCTRFLPTEEWPELLAETTFASPQVKEAAEAPWLARAPHATATRFQRGPLREPLSTTDIAVAVMTIDRGHAYVHDTLRSLRREWPDGHVSLLAGSPKDEYLSPYLTSKYSILPPSADEWKEISLWSVNRKTMWNYWRCLAKETPADRIQGRLILEDDVRFAKGWRDRFLHCADRMHREHDGIFVLTLYWPHPGIPAATKAGPLGHRCNSKAFWGTQGVYFPEAVRRDFAEYLKLYGVDDNLMPHDVMIGHFCAEQGIPILATVPSLVQHTGKSTTGLSPGFHTAPSFLEDVRVLPEPSIPSVAFTTFQQIRGT